VKVIAYELARATALFPLEETLPLNGADGREILAKIKDRYNFAKATDPAVTTREEIAKSGYKFETGVISRNNTNTSILDLAVYSDGIVANASKTDDAEFVIRDLIEFCHKELGFREPITAPGFFYLSQIVVEFERPLDRLISSFKSIAEAISKNLPSSLNLSNAPDFTRLDLSWDKKVLPPGMAMPRFIIERRNNIPFEKERYFCGAPLKTEAHLQVLEDIEKSIG
jgi:hypothetical protein